MAKLKEAPTRPRRRWADKRDAIATAARIVFGREGYTRASIDAIASDLKTKGVEFTKEPTTVRPGVRICFIRGPEGVSIELLDRSVK